ncbi:hypothetical protein RR48_14973 [Papilio machaon]|uniref:Uncharacterized protein n=1 Tax=Papilio machaon TaxID=76193 RepID=A0A194R1D9_PAPMA|nr:uncharacterized protein LOC123721072 [Papilio machaon]KPJ11334.1 hypothetical protein RR48_14973 [Papilio machaon]
MGEPSSDSNTYGMENWTKEEKYNLFQALKVCDFHDYEKLSTFITTKSIDDIRGAIAHYKNKISKHPVLYKKVKKSIKKTGGNLIPLTDWAKFLTESLNLKDLRTETATALRLIADFEEFPAPICTNNIDFSKIYHTLANALEGKALTKDKMIISMMDKCLIDSALTSKAFIRSSSFKNVLKTLNMSDNELNSFPHYTDNQELANIRHLASLRSYNPLNLSEDVLRPS